MIIDNFVQLLGSMFAGSSFYYFFVPIIALAFVATVPCIIRFIVRR